MRIIKIILLFFCMTTTSLNLFGQQSITVVKFKDGSAFIEITKMHSDLFGGSSYTSDIGKYWISSQTNLSFQAALKKAVSWAKLNEEHRKEFEKEVIRIKVIDKDKYEFFKPDISRLTKEAKLIFQGHDDGSFTLNLSITDDVVNITLDDEEGINNFIKLLQGKSVNKDIDEIFH